MSDVNKEKRPLSPHLSIYRPQLTSVTSILNRITGNSLIISVILIVWWLLAASVSEEHFNFVNTIILSFVGKMILVCSTWALWYHTLAGIRHLIWDRAIGLELDVAYRLGWAVITGSIILTAITIILHVSLVQ